ncbi:hypothetical protein [Streptomyces lunaelactis]|uniref:hypothetical protein n=1 Tax=Streptomyces lunaelactis TaxID=1535768 RepID=UPI0015852A7F|nr:hypothetical protein [Streptomyces lunaelactis]NUK23491.1 hypothetical protein [Streptomyces lunaelactis]
MDEEDERHLRGLLTLLDTARRFDQLTSGESASESWRVQASSQLAIDDARTNPHHVSHAAWNALTVAVDHLQALRGSLIQEMTANSASAVLHTHAQASLVRGVVENGARAVWLLGPDFRPLRIERRLALQAKEVKSSTKLHERMGAAPPRTEAVRLEELKQLALAAGTPADRVREALAPPQYTEIVRQAGEYSGLGDVVEAIWSVCSSLAHGDLTGTVGLLQREIVATEGNVSLTKITGAFSTLHHMTRGAVHVLDHGFALYHKRATRP